ncbi:hypothetical protein [Streptomyces sp. NPDC057557]|uniref:hypothetical protein n=1 Tax=Streptomyces sp. NPDC057557 TaxID=3346167 RepID=UPI00369C2B6E
MDEFGRIVAPGGADVVIVGMAGHSFTGNLTVEERQQLRGAPAADLMSLPLVADKNFTDSGATCVCAKRANHPRIQDIAAAEEFLLRAAAGFITGTTAVTTGLAGPGQ